MNMKRAGALMRAMVAAVTAFALAVALAGCSAGTTYQPPEGEPAVSAPVIGENGVLRVGVNADNPPLAGMGNDKIIGIDIDIAAALADSLGLKLQITDVGSNPAAALADGSVDVVMGIDQSETDPGFWLTQSYLPTAIALFSLEEDAKVPALGGSSRFAAQVSSKSAWAVGNEFGTEAVVSTTNLPDAFADLEDGTVNYVAADAIIGYYAAHSRGMQVYVTALLSRAGGYCIGVSGDNVELQQVVSDALDSLVSGDVVGYIEKKWLGTALNLSDVPLTAGAETGQAASEDASQDADNENQPGSNAVGSEDEADGAAGTDEDASAEDEEASSDEDTEA